jgi:pyruvate,water dikinase
MGHDKADIRIGGTTLARRTAAVLTRVLSPVVEIGAGRTDLPCSAEDPPGRGPLAAVAAAAELLTDLGHHGPAVVVATDLPRLGTRAVHDLACHPGAATVVPVVGGRPQWLAARWAADDLCRASSLVRRGVRRLGSLGVGARFLEDPPWADELVDVDTPEDLVELFRDPCTGDPG